MKIYFSKKSDYAIGRGFSFARNIETYLNKKEIIVTDNINGKFDAALIIGPTTISRDDFKKLVNEKIPTVLRLDNIPEDYRNRGTAISRLKDFSQEADIVVYQSQWAKEYMMSLINRDGTIIYNGVDTNIFHKNGRKVEKRKTYLYVRSSTNESKRWQEAKYMFRREWLNNKNSILYVVGNFADYIKLYGNEFIDRYKLGMFDEPFKYFGQVKDPQQMADIYRQSDILIAPYYNDACSNVLMEARLCGCDIMFGTAEHTGSNQEIMQLKEHELSADWMSEQYLGIFKLLT